MRGVSFGIIGLPIKYFLYDFCTICDTNCCSLRDLHRGFGVSGRPASRLDDGIASAEINSLPFYRRASRQQSTVPSRSRCRFYCLRKYWSGGWDEHFTFYDSTSFICFLNAFIFFFLFILLPVHSSVYYYRVNDTVYI